MGKPLEHCPCSSPLMLRHLRSHCLFTAPPQFKWTGVCDKHSGPLSPKGVASGITTDLSLAMRSWTITYSGVFFMIVSPSKAIVMIYPEDTQNNQTSPAKHYKQSLVSYSPARLLPEQGRLLLFVHSCFKLIINKSVLCVQI